uniref:2S seed storage albumin protein (Fragments) n=1 Tax=Matteuccia struthiopteris TaxID=3277 RepID=2SS_MATST|nr:RecName: Full=2S seed storage albumin protein; AltName: Full=Matteuccin; Contains: RecName: Full=Matteuccin light chain; Contains: RecName: Full=Matteuccin heavy chain [Matteuccia struthiopteris]
DQASMQRASRLLHQCDLRPRDCARRSSERGQGERWRQQLRACDEDSEPRQQCCQNLQRISSQDRCRA